MIARWQAWIHRAEGGAPLALFRCVLALTLVWAVGEVMFTGALDLIWVDVNHGGYRRFANPHALVDWLGGASPAVMWGLAWTVIGLSIGLFLGIGGRMTPLLLLITFSAVDINSHAGGSYDLMIKNALWLAVLCPTTATWSIDAWMLRGSPWTGRPVPAWARAIILFQLILIYWTTGVQKVSAHWVPGGDLMALYYILQQPSWQITDMSWLARWVPLTQFATFTTWLWEVTTPLWLVAHYCRGTAERGGWLRRQIIRLEVRTWYVVVGLAFHLVLLLTMNVGPFPWISLAYYMVCYSEDELRTTARRVVEAARARKGAGMPARP